MTIFAKTTLALMLGAALTAAATPALAKHRHHRSHSVHAHRVHITVTRDYRFLNSHRAMAIRQCTGLHPPFGPNPWGAVQNDSFVSCLSQRGEPF